MSAITQETPSAVSFEVDGQMDFRAGQFVLLRPSPQLPWRAYSFSRAPGLPLRLTVKRVSQGPVSTHLTTKLAPGDILEVKGPYGHFVLPSFQRALFIAGGSGITPFLSMLQEQEQKGWPAPVRVLDFNRSGGERIFKTELEALCQSSRGRLEVVHVLDDASEAPRGPPSREVFAALLGEGPEVDLVAMCGPQPMMELARQAATARFPGARVLEERFSLVQDHAAGGPVHQVKLLSEGKSQSFSVKEGEHLLAAARRAGLNLAAGCEMGACGVCRVRVLEGHIHLPDDACLSEAETGEGYALMCVGTVKGDCRIEPAP